MATALTGLVAGFGTLGLVHAFSPAQAVIEEPLARNGLLAQPHRTPRFFSLWGAP
jgi:hypothetical protein